MKKFVTILLMTIVISTNAISITSDCRIENENFAVILSDFNSDHFHKVDTK